MGDGRATEYGDKDMIQETSLAAHKDIKKLLNSKQSDVIAVFRLQHPQSLSNANVADILGWSINTVTPRVKELRDNGYLVYKGVKKCIKTGRIAMQWGIEEEPKQMSLF